MNHRRPLRDVLVELCRDVQKVAAQGGRVCAHHIEHDAGILDIELRRAGMDFGKDIWSWGDMVRDGLCLMGTDVAQWICNVKGPVKLDTVVTRLLPKMRADANPALKCWQMTRELRIAALKRQCGNNDAAHRAG